MSVPTGTQQYVVKLDGRFSGRLYSFNGGKAKLETTVEATRAGSLRASSVWDFEPVELAFGTGMSDSFYSWI